MMDEEMMMKRRADALAAANDYYDDRDYEKEDRESCADHLHPFSYVGSFGPSCECGDRFGPDAGFSPEEIARGTLALMIYKHDKKLPRDGQSQ